MHWISSWLSYRNLHSNVSQIPHQLLFWCLSFTSLDILKQNNFGSRSMKWVKPDLESVDLFQGGTGQVWKRSRKGGVQVGAFWSTTTRESRALKTSILCSRYIFIKRGYNEAINPRRNTARSMSCRGRKLIRMNSLACVSLPAVCIPSDTPHSQRAIAQSFTFLLLLLECYLGTQFILRAAGGSTQLQVYYILEGEKTS